MTAPAPTMAGHESQPALPPEASWYDRFWSQQDTGTGQPGTPLAPWYQSLLPELEHRIEPHMRLVELGCGLGPLLRILARSGRIPAANLWGVDQSQAALESIRRELPDANLHVLDLNHLSLDSTSFDVAVMLETIEHLEDPLPALKSVHRLLRPGGSFYLSFPNYVHLPWLAVRILAQVLRRPNWIVLQPIDRIYFYPSLVRRIEAIGFRKVRAVGSVFGPPILYRWEKPRMTRFLTRCGLAGLSFHPVIEFQRT